MKPKGICKGYHIIHEYINNGSNIRIKQCLRCGCFWYPDTFKEQGAGKVSLNKKTIKCKHCKGTGEEPHSKNKDYNGLSCLECNGCGELYYEQEQGAGK